MRHPRGYARHGQSYRAERLPSQAAVLGGATKYNRILNTTCSINYTSIEKKTQNSTGTSLVVQWLRIHLPTQGTWKILPAMGPLSP